MNIRTHYDNLHIPQNASADEIRQAYRRLSKQYHPDINPSSDAHRIMQLINQAYEVLSNPQKRAEHDRWISEQQANIGAQHIMQKMPNIVVRPQPNTPMPNTKNYYIGWMVVLLFITLITMIFLGLHIFRTHQRQPENNSTAYTNNTSLPTNNPNTVPSYIRPFAAPNGNPWPNESAYIDGYPLIYGRAQHTLLVDNLLNSSDVYAQLWQEGNNEPLRHFFIPERAYFMLHQLDSGKYTIRYQQLDAGEELRSETITINAQHPNNTIRLKRGQSPQH